VDLRKSSFGRFVQLVCRISPGHERLTLKVQDGGQGSGNSARARRRARN